MVTGLCVHRVSAGSIRVFIFDERTRPNPSAVLHSACFVDLDTRHGTVRDLRYAITAKQGCPVGTFDVQISERLLGDDFDIMHLPQIVDGWEGVYLVHKTEPSTCAVM